VVIATMRRNRIEKHMGKLLFAQAAKMQKPRNFQRSLFSDAPVQLLFQCNCYSSAIIRNGIYLPVDKNRQFQLKKSGWAFTPAWNKLSNNFFDFHEIFA